MYRIVKTSYIDMAHRIRGHPGKCRHLHGHTWMIELSVSCADDDLNDLGMVVDFSLLKEQFFALIDERFDHSCLLSSGDRDAMAAGEHTDEDGIHTSLHHLAEDLELDIVELGVKFFEGNLTAETLAKFFYDMAVGNIQNALVSVDYVRVYEQLHPTVSYAEYRPSEEKNDGS